MYKHIIFRISKILFFFFSLPVRCKIRERVKLSSSLGRHLIYFNVTQFIHCWTVQAGHEILKHHIDHRQTQSQQLSLQKFWKGSIFKRKLLHPVRAKKRQIMALKIMLGLLNNAKSYARTKDNSLPTYIEVRFEKRNVFNHGSCIRRVSKWMNESWGSFISWNVFLHIGENVGVIISVWEKVEELWKN